MYKTWYGKLVVQLNQLCSTPGGLNFRDEKFLDFQVTLRKKWNFSLRILAVNVNQSVASWRFGDIAEEMLNGKLHFLLSGSINDFAG